MEVGILRGWQHSSCSNSGGGSDGLRHGRDRVPRLERRHQLRPQPLHQVAPAQPRQCQPQPPPPPQLLAYRQSRTRPRVQPPTPTTTASASAATTPPPADRRWAVVIVVHSAAAWRGKRLLRPRPAAAVAQVQRNAGENLGHRGPIVPARVRRQ